jgi:hypothetical protein
MGWQSSCACSLHNARSFLSTQVLASKSSSAQMWCWRSQAMATVHCVFYIVLQSVRLQSIDTAHTPVCSVLSLKQKTTFKQLLQAQRTDVQLSRTCAKAQTAADTASSQLQQPVLSAQQQAAAAAV